MGAIRRACTTPTVVAFTAAVFAVLLPAGATSLAAPYDYLNQEQWEAAVREHDVDPDTIVNPLAATEEMRATARKIAGYGSARQKLDQIQIFLFDNREFRFSYDAEVTLTAQEAFETRTGNCVSFTNLFISLARSLGLPVRPALVFRREDPEIDGDLIIVNNHIVAAYQSGSETMLYDFYRFRKGAVVGFEPIDDLWNTGVYLNNMGTRALRGGDHDEALRLLEAAVRLAPRFTAAYGNLGVVRRRTGDPHGALEAYLQAMRLEEHNATIRSNLSKLIQVEAERRIRAAGWSLDTLPPTAEGMVMRGDLLLASRHVERARDMYREANRSYPDSPLPLVAMARLHMIRGRMAASNRAINRALRLDPASLEARRLQEVLARIENF